jgi:hypothetical protein
MAIYESHQAVYFRRETERFSMRRALALWFAFSGGVWLAGILLTSVIVRIF